MTRLRATTGYSSGESMMTRASTRRDFIIHSAAAGTLLACGRTFAQPSDLADLTIEDAAGLIRARSISPVELAQTYLERIDDIDRRLNTFITVTDDLALRQAREMEAELSNGRWRGPLHGIPVALKDNIDTAGIPTTAASAPPPLASPSTTSSQPASSSIPARYSLSTVFLSQPSVTIPTRILNSPLIP